jgi:hypothetical protein
MLLIFKGEMIEDFKFKCFGYAGEANTDLTCIIPIFF